jgi:hypothetical protein
MRAKVCHAAAAFLLLHSAVAFADGSCAVRLVDPRAQTEWRSAVDAAAVAVRAADTGDCASIVVTAEERGAVVTFTTRDGRIAQRHIHRPAELMPLVDALTVTVPPAVVAAPVAPEATIAFPAEEEQEEESVAPAMAPAEPAMARPANHDVAPSSNGRTALLFHASGGAKRSGRADSVAPQAEFGMSVALRRWELGLVGRVEAERDLATSAASRVELSSIGAGARVGRRDALGNVLVLTGLAFSGQAATLESHSRTQSNAEHEKTFFDPRLGAYIGAVSPPIGPVRFRGDLMAEVAVTPRPASSDFPAAPGWGVGAMLGVETSFLP